jgi:hypothetical protein
MGLPINPNSPSPVPGVTPATPGSGGFTPLQLVLVDTFSTSLSSSLPAPPADASQPTLASFFSSVGSAELKELLQNYADASADPLVMQKLLQEAVSQAGGTANVIAEIVAYHELLANLNKLNLAGAETSLNNSIDSFNSNSPADTTQINNMNGAINDYNTAQTNYQNALTTYQGDLTTFSGAQTTYNSALSTWNTALSSYNSGGSSAGQLQTAQTTFDSAQTQFASAQTDLSTAETMFGNAKTAWTSAQTALTSQSQTYNAYAQGQDGTLSNSIQAYNTAIDNALPIISQMNNLQSFFFGVGVSLPSPTTYSASGLPIFDQGTPGPDTLRNQVEGTLDNDNDTSTDLNTTIGDITTIINTINSGGYTPPLTAPQMLTPIATLPTANSNYAITPLSYTPPGDESFNFTALTQLDTTFLTIMLDATDQINTLNTQQNNFRKQVVDAPNTFVVDNAPTTSAGLGSSVAVSAQQPHAPGGRPNPHLLRILSRNVFETAIGAYGVKAGSPFVDQFGALAFNYKRVAAFTSIGPAKGILGENSTADTAGQTAARAAVALGNVAQVQTLISSNQITADVTQLVNQNATLAALTPEAKTALIQTLVQEIGATLIKSSLNQLAASLNLPGLVSQILASLSPSAAAPGAPQTNLQQVGAELTLAQELSKDLNISSAAAASIVQTAIQQLTQQNTALSANSITQAILNQIGQQGGVLATIIAQGTQSNAAAAGNQQEQSSEDEDEEESDAIAADNLKADNLKAAVLTSTIETNEANQANIQSEALTNSIQSEDAANQANSQAAAQTSNVQADAVNQDNLQAAVLKSVIAADATNRANIQAAQIHSDNGKRDAFLHSLAESLEAQQIEPTLIKKLLDTYRPTVLNALISGLAKPNFLEALTNHLIQLHLTPGQAGQAAQTAISKANAQDSALNPLSTFMGSQVIGMTQISALFKKQVTDLLTPVVGQKQALDVAENYGRLIFASPNSFTKKLENNEKTLAAYEGYNHNARVFEDYRNAQQVFINPLDDPGSPLLKGNTLILSGPAAGISTQGTTSADNALGPLGYRNKKPIDMPG